MKIKELLKLLFPDKHTDIDKLEDEKPATPPATTTPPAVSTETKLPAEVFQLVESMKAENQKLLDALAAQTKKDEDREKLLADQAKAAAKAKIDAAIQKAKDEKRIPAKDEAAEARYRKLMEVDFENGEAALNALPKIADSNSTQSSTKTNDVKTTTTDTPFKVDRTALKDAISAQMESYKN